MKTRNRWLVIAACTSIALISVWIIIDLNNRSRHDLRSFDGHEVAKLETAMWRSYYEHHPARLFREMALLLRRQYHLPFWQSNVAAWHAARAAVVFQKGHGRPDYSRALPDLERFYSTIRQHSVTPFDVDTVARLELEWWIIHRERARHVAADLELALAKLQSAIYGQPASLFDNYAKGRAQAMLLRDARAESGSTPSEQDWRTIGTLLDQSWTGLQTVVAKSPQLSRSPDLSRDLHD